MIDSQNKGLPFPKGDFKRKINGRTDFEYTEETKTLPASANWNTTLFGLQLEYLPALAEEAIGQTIYNPVVNCLTDANTRIVRLKRPDGTQPEVGEVYLDIYNGIIQFNSADAGKSFKVDYYKKASLLDHNAMNRIWEAGHTWVVGDESWHDFSNLQDCFDNCSDGDSVKLLKDITTTGLTLDKKILFNGNNKKIIKSGSLTGSRAIDFSADCEFLNIEFVDWNEVDDVCLFASTDVKAIIHSNKNTNGTKLTNAADVCTQCIVENNLPVSENIGYAITYVTNNVVSGLISQLVAETAINVGDPVFLGSSAATCKTLTSWQESDIFVGVAMNNVSIGGTVDIITSGLCSVFSGLTIGTEYFVSRVGTITTNNNNSVLSLGKALTNSSINVDPKINREYISKIYQCNFSITKGKAVFLSSGALTDSLTTSINGKFLGIANNDVVSSGVLEVILSGVVSYSSYSLTTNGYVYAQNGGTVSSTNNKVMDTGSTASNALSIYKIGYALSTTSFLLINPKANIITSAGLVSGSISSNSTAYQDLNNHRHFTWSAFKSLASLMSMNLISDSFSTNFLQFNGVNANATITFEIRALNDAGSGRSTYDVIGKCEYICKPGGNDIIDLNNMKITFDTSVLNSSRTILSFYWTVSGLSAGTISFSINGFYFKEE